MTSDSVIGDFERISETPDWIMDDESPATYNSTEKMKFLLQVKLGVKFYLVDGALPPIELGLEGIPVLSPLNYYQIFLGDAIYLA